MHLTQKQRELVDVISRGNPDGTPTDLDEIVERLSYKPSKQSLQFSLRALIAHGLIEKLEKDKRRERVRRLIGITPLGMHFSSVSKTKFVLTEEEDGEISELESLGFDLDSK